MARPRWKRLTITAVKAVVAIVVLWAVGRQVLRAYGDLRSKSESLHFEPVWLVLAGLLYLAGLLACAVFYERIMRTSPTPIGLVPACRAYIVSHLGKYVPGKAMVVVLRSGMVVPHGARASTAAIATFYETLVMMAAGGLVAAAGFAGASGSNTIELTIWGWHRVELPIYRIGRARGVGSGPGALDSRGAARLRPRGRSGGASDPGGGPRCPAAHHGEAVGAGSVLVVGGLDLARPEPARGRAGV